MSVALVPAADGLPGRAGPAGLRCRCAARRPASHLHGSECEQTCNSIGHPTALGSSSRPTHSLRTGQEGRRVHDCKWYEACSGSLQMGKEDTFGGARKVCMTTLPEVWAYSFKSPLDFCVRLRCGQARPLRAPPCCRWAAPRSCHHGVACRHEQHAQKAECLCAALTAFRPVLCTSKARTTR